MEIFRILGTLAVNNEQANQALAETSQQAGQTSGEMSGAFSKIGSAAATIGKAVVGAGIALGTAWVAAIEGSREYRTEMGKLDTAFTTNGHSSAAAKKTYSELNAVLGDSSVAVEAANHLAVMTDNEKDLKTWTDICTGVYATFGDSLPIEGLTEAANETAKTGVVTGSLADALNWAGISEDEFNDKLAGCSSEQERQKLIMDTLNGTYKKASTQYKETNKDILAANKAQEKLTAAFDELGRVGEPILTAIKNKVAQMVTAAVPHLENLIRKVKDTKKWMQDNKNTVDKWKAAIVGAGASAASFVLILKWSAIMSAASKAIKGVTAAVKLLNIAMKANLIGLIISLVIGLVAAFVTLWKNNESFRNFWINLWNKIKSACQSAVSGIKNKFNDLKGALKTVQNTFSKIKDTITDKMDAARDKVKGVMDKIKGFFPLKIGKIFSNLKIPKISVSGGKAPFGIAGKGSLPSFNVKWNAQGAVFDEPTIFSTHQGLQGVGENGPEAVAPIDTLQAYIRESVKDKDERLIRTLIEQNKQLMDFLERIIPHDIRLDGNALVGELVPAIDMGLNDRYSHTRRGNVR